MPIAKKVLQLIKKLKKERGDDMGKVKTKKVVVLSTEVGKFGSVIELPDNEKTAKLLSEGKVEEKK